MPISITNQSQPLVIILRRESEWITISDFKDKAANELIDGYNAAAVPDGLVADRLDEAGYGIALKLDSDGAKALAKMFPVDFVVDLNI